jgi:hypothetical protein
MMRKIGSCMNCGEAREMAAHGLCFKCYRQQERERSDEEAIWARRGEGAILREQKKAFTILTRILRDISDCPSLRGDHKNQIQCILRPYIDWSLQCFAPKTNTGPANRELAPECSHPMANEIENSERTVNEHPETKM